MGDESPLRTRGRNLSLIGLAAFTPSKHSDGQTRSSEPYAGERQISGTFV